MNKYINKLIYIVSIWIVVIDINLRDIEGVALAIRVLSVIVNNHLLVILILIIYNEYINSNIGKYYLLDKYKY